MFGSKFVRWSGLAVIGAGMAILALFAATMLFEELEGSGWEPLILALPLLWVIGLGWIGLGYLLWTSHPTQSVSLGEATSIMVLIPLLLLLTACVGFGPQAAVNFTEPANGATVDAPFTAKMMAENFALEPAGEVRNGAGHLHIMVDTDCISPGNVIPKDATHLHYGNGQSEATLDLLPGQYKLCLQAADGAHIALPGDGMADEINVTVANYNGPRVFFASPTDGAIVSSSVQVTMASENFTVEPAGEVHERAGHLHIMVDTPCLPAGEVIPKDEMHLHYGNGQTEADIELAPGKHTLCLQAADGAHIALPGAGMTQVFEVTVQ